MQTTFRSSVPQYTVEIDRLKTQTLRVATDQVFAALADYLGASYVNQFNKFGRTFQIYVQADSRIPAAAGTTSTTSRSATRTAAWCRSARW